MGVTEEKTYGYYDLKRWASSLGFAPVNLNTDVALQLAAMSPYPRGVKLGVMKQLANDKAVTLRQMSILLNWAADRAMR